jgi:hypothetical protein
MSEASLLFRHRQVFDDGAILEAIVWKLTRPMAGSVHPYKYRLFYGYAGERVIGYDNERSKGDHRHYRRQESAYTFVSPRRLIDDFLADVASERSRS